MKKIKTLAVISIFFLLIGTGQARAEEQSISDRVMHYRAIDAVVWAMPMLNFLAIP